MTVKHEINFASECMKVVPGVVELNTVCGTYCCVFVDGNK